VHTWAHQKIEKYVKDFFFAFARPFASSDDKIARLGVALNTDYSEIINTRSGFNSVGGAITSSHD